MAVRFLPPPEERPTSHAEERENLAEVIELRTRLRSPEPKPAVTSAPRDEVKAVRIAHLAERIEAVVSADAAPSAEPARSAGSGDRSPAPARKLSVRLETKLVAAEPEETTAHDMAIALLARRALSSGELRRALLEAEHPSVDVEQAVAECEVSLYLDDGALARSMAEKLRASKGESRSRIRQRLRERLLPDAVIDEALAELDDDEEIVLLERTAFDRAQRLRGVDRQTAERRLLGFLARRGWSGERATRAAREALDEVLGASSGGFAPGGSRFSSSGPGLLGAAPRRDASSGGKLRFR